MSKRFLFCLFLLLAPLAGLIALAQLGAQNPESKKEPANPPAKVEVAATPVKPKPLSDNVKKGLAYLVNQQHTDGGWGQGGGWRQGDKGGGRVEGTNVADPSDLGNTCIAVLALMRAGNTPKDGEYAKNVTKAIDFILTKIEKADTDTLYLTDVRNTQIQSKIGPYVDTFLAQLVMAELKGKMPEEKSEKRLLAAFDKTMTKIAKHQKADGNFDKNDAWASTLSMALCSKGINRAAQNGYTVPPPVLAADQKANTVGLDLKKGTFTAPASGAGGAATGAPSDAGVEVYSRAAKTSGLQESVNTLKKSEEKNREIVKSPEASKPAKEQAMKDLDRLGEAQTASKAAVDGLVRRLDDKTFIQGFGSNGGEEFLSYMNISETLLVQGGKDWLAWDKGITDSLVRVQDKDGGWSGQHCITGRTFCTAAALLTMLADRAPIPVVKKDDKKDDKKDEEK
jgi:Prenyltransferase and squalene oxidase repeat